VRHFAFSTSLAITRYTSSPCPRCNICCFCNLNALYSLFCKLHTHTSDRLVILHIDRRFMYIVYCFLFVCFSLYHSLMNKVAQWRASLGGLASPLVVATTQTTILRPACNVPGPCVSDYCIDPTDGRTATTTS